MSTLAPKKKLEFRMRRYARLAAHARLAGRMRQATGWDDEIEKVYREAKRLRLREGFLVLAEERGRNEGQRAYDRERGMRTSSPSGRDRRRRARRRR